jgi:hypothetical protein
MINLHPDVAYQQLGIAQRIAPTIKEQEGFTNIVNTARRHNCTEKQVVQQLLYAMLDGLQHDNWPSADKE